MTSRLVASTGRFHTYSLDGKRVPGVTTITGAMDKGGLANAAAKEVALWAAIHAGELDTLGADEWAQLASGAHRRKWDVSRDNGTAVHHIAHRLVFGEPVPDEGPDGLPWSDDVRRMGEQAARWMDRWDVEPILVEAPVFYDGRRPYAGTLDLVADLKDGARWLLDWKTSESGIWHETALQVCAYGNATHVQIGARGPNRDETDQLMPKVDRYGALWIRPDHCQLIPLHVTTDTFRVFRALQQVQAWAAQKRDLVVGAALPLPKKTTGDAA
jgi:hypothetical protein